MIRIPKFRLHSLEVSATVKIAMQCFEIFGAGKFPKCHPLVARLLGTIGLFPLQLSSPSCFNTTSCHALAHFWPQQTTSLASSQNMAPTCVFFNLNPSSLESSL